MNIVLDVNDLTMGEVEELEEATGQSLSDLGSGSAKSIIGLIWISQKRIDPTFTLQDARALKITELKFSKNPEAAGAS